MHTVGGEFWKHRYSPQDNNYSQNARSGNYQISSGLFTARPVDISVESAIYDVLISGSIRCPTMPSKYQTRLNASGPELPLVKTQWETRNTIRPSFGISIPWTTDMCATSKSYHNHINQIHHSPSYSFSVIEPQLRMLGTVYKVKRLHPGKPRLNTG